MCIRDRLPFDAPYYYSFDENGNIIYGDHAEYLHYSGQSNPNDFNRLAWPHTNRNTVSAMLNLYEQIQPIKGLTIRAQQALSAFDYRSSNHRPAYGTWVTPMGDTVNDWTDTPASASESFQRWYQWTYTNTIEYKFNIADKHDFSVLAGQESVISKNNSFGVSTVGQPNANQWPVSYTHLDVYKRQVLVVVEVDACAYIPVFVAENVAANFHIHTGIGHSADIAGA